MPTIPEYYAPNTDLNPSATGVSAWEQAGRRIGPLYNEAATFKQREGALAAQAERQKMWPFDILQLYARRDAEDAAGRQAQKDRNTVNIRVANGGRASSLFAADNPGARYNDLGQVSRGAAAIGQAVSDGGYGAAKGKPGGAPPSSGGGFGDEYTLLNGQFVSAADARRIEAQDRADAAKYYGDYGSKLSDYYQQYYGYKPNGQTPTAEEGRPVSNMYPAPSSLAAPVPQTETGGYGGYSSPTGMFDRLRSWISNGTVPESDTGVTY